MPNPGGTNQFQGFGKEPPYGDVQRQQSLIREAPMSGAPVPATSAPRRAQRAAGTPRRTAPRSAGTAQEYQIDPATELARLAAMPGASPLLQEYALLAQQQGAVNGSR